MNMDLSTTLGWIATFLFTICYIPQIIKTRKTNTVEGLSFLFLAISFIANIIALSYATLIGQAPLQVKYLLALALLIFTLYEYFKVVRKQVRATTQITEEK